MFKYLHLLLSIMGLSDKTINVDFEQIFGDIKDYFSSLSTLQMIAWGAILLGVVLVIVSFFI